MATEFALNILSPSKSLSAVKARALTIPGLLGYMTILPEHTAMVAELDVGEMLVTDSSTSERSAFFISGGFVEVMGDTVNVLADFVEIASDIDLPQAEDDRKKAIKGLEGKGEEVDLDRFSKLLKESDYKIKIAKSVAS